ESQVTGSQPGLSQPLVDRSTSVHCIGVLATPSVRSPRSEDEASSGADCCEWTRSCHMSSRSAGVTSDAGGAFDSALGGCDPRDRSRSDELVEPAPSSSQWQDSHERDGPAFEPQEERSCSPFDCSPLGSSPDSCCSL